MNTICQDRGITENALDFAHSTSKHHSQAIIRSDLETLRTTPLDHCSVGTSTQKQVGKNRGVSWQNFANWIQLANGCQLKSLLDQELVEFPIQLAVGSWKILPTELSHCFDSIFITSEVGEISPLPTGEVNTPTGSRGCSPLASRVEPVPIRVEEI